jgi:aminoglycoside phosphotransferase family enzyme
VPGARYDAARGGGREPNVNRSPRMMIDPPLGEKVAHLCRPEGYPELPARVEAIETHMSWVFLTDRFAYKLKKPVRYDRLDFTTLSLRRFYCEEEVRLNRRLAAAVYVGTLALTQDDSGALSLGGAGRPVEWLVQMRRLPEPRRLDHILSRRLVEREEVTTVAHRLADFYAHAHHVAVTGADFRARLTEGIREDRRELERPEFGLPTGRVRAAAANLLDFLEKHGACFEARVREGRIVEGHGDLRPEHIYLSAEPAVVDCLEFCRELRELDPLDDLAFLALECELLGQPDVGRWFLEIYERLSGDRLCWPLVRFYRGYRILRRAKIAAWHLEDPAAPDPARFAAKATRYLELAEPAPDLGDCAGSKAPDGSPS